MTEKVKNYFQNDRGICYIVGAGEPFFLIKPRENDCVIAADGGLDKLRSIGIRPDLIVGDFDSAEVGGDACFAGVPVERHPVMKDETDMAIAALRAYDMGFCQLVLLGGTGGREDHTFANYQLLLRLWRMGVRAVLVGERCLVRVVENASVSLFGAVGETLSVFAFGREAHGVTLSGVLYPMQGGELSCDFALGVSNAFAQTSATVEVIDGALLLFSPLPSVRSGGFFFVT